MLLTLGSRSYDVTTRALVVGVLTVASTPLPTLCRDAERLVDEGADLLDLADAGVDDVCAAVGALSTGVAVPLGVLTSRMDVSGPAVAAGASLTRDPGVAHATGAALVVSGAALARTAARCGIAPERIVLDIAPRVRPTPDELALGYPVLTSACPPPAGAEDARAAVLATAALAVSSGCRLVRTADVRGIRRVRDVLAAVLAAGEEPR